jgi:hypothetical protein
MRATAARFVICLSNGRYPASLEPRKLYQEIPDADAARNQLIRVIDESGDDYLFPSAMFLPVELSTEAKDAILRAS